MALRANRRNRLDPKDKEHAAFTDGLATELLRQFGGGGLLTLFLRPSLHYVTSKDATLRHLRASALHNCRDFRGKSLWIHILPSGRPSPSTVFGLGKLFSSGSCCLARCFRFPSSAPLKLLLRTLGLLVSQI